MCRSCKYHKNLKMHKFKPNPHLNVWCDAHAHESCILRVAVGYYWHRTTLERRVQPEDCFFVLACLC